MTRNSTVNNDEILKKLSLSAKNCRIYTYDVVSSTNLLAKDFIKHGITDNAVIIARGQTQGKGRHGKSFFSPKDKGIYISFIFDFKNNQKIIPFITSYVAVAVCKALQQTTKCSPKIKWVNDIYLDNRKLAGILVEREYDTEQNNTVIIIGIGVNVSLNNNDFPDDIRNIAGSLEDESVSKNLLCSHIINEVSKIKDAVFDLSVYKEYMHYSFMVGKTIAFERNGRQVKGEVINIDENINLAVKTEDNEIFMLSSGETIILM